jgi:uncharacterized membrane protein
MRSVLGLEWLAWALAAAVLNGLSTLAAKPTADRLGTWVMGLGGILAEGVAFGVAALLLPPEAITAGANFVFASIPAGVLGAVGYLFFFAGMQHGTVGLVDTISAAAPVLTVVLSVSFLGAALLCLIVILLMLGMGGLIFDLFFAAVLLLSLLLGIRMLVAAVLGRRLCLGAWPARVRRGSIVSVSSSCGFRPCENQR